MTKWRYFLLCLRPRGMDTRLHMATVQAFTQGWILRQVLLLSRAAFLTQASVLLGLLGLVLWALL